MNARSLPRLSALEIVLSPAIIENAHDYRTLSEAHPNST
jgi:hypothetical protein